MFFRVIKLFGLMLMCGLAANAAAHRYFFSISELSVNEKNQTLEIIHQLTAHDIDNAIAENKQISFSTEHPQYELYIQQYIEKHFQLLLEKRELTLNWVGIEITKGNIFIYQETDFKNFISGLVVKNHILVDTYPKQVNTVNYRDSKIKGSLTFTRSVIIDKIAINN